jgi:large conductance mechanosensitive channel
MWSDFKAFVMRGNVLDLAIAVIIGAAFATVVKSLVDDVIMPPIGLALGGVDFTDLFVVLRDGPEGPAQYLTLADAKAAGAVTINYGLFLNNVVAFLVVALAVFMLVRAANKLAAKPVPPTPNTKTCQYCASIIPLAATRCPNCTSQLTESSRA